MGKDINPLLDQIETFAKSSCEIVKLKTIAKISFFTSTLIVYSMLAIILFLGVFIASIGASLWLNQWLHSGFMGFFCVAGAYVAVAILLRLFFPLITSHIANFLVRKITSQ